MKTVWIKGFGTLVIAACFSTFSAHAERFNVDVAVKKIIGDGVSAHVRAFAKIESTLKTSETAIFRAIKEGANDTSEAAFYKALAERYGAIKNGRYELGVDTLLQKDLQALTDLKKNVDASDTESHVMLGRMISGLRQFDGVTKEMVKNGSLRAWNSAEADLIKKVDALYDIQNTDTLGYAQSGAGSVLYVRWGAAVNSRIIVSAGSDKWANLLGDVFKGMEELQSIDLKNEGDIDLLRLTYKSIAKRILPAAKGNNGVALSLMTLAENLNPNRGKLWLGVMVGGMTLREIVGVTQKGIPLSVLLSEKQLKQFLGNGAPSAYTKAFGEFREVFESEVAPRSVEETNGKGAAYLDLQAAWDFFVNDFAGNLRPAAPTIFFGKIEEDGKSLDVRIAQALGKEGVDEEVRRDIVRLANILKLTGHNARLTQTLESVLALSKMNKDQVAKLRELQPLQLKCVGQ